MATCARRSRCGRSLEPASAAALARGAHGMGAGATTMAATSPGGPGALSSECASQASPSIAGLAGPWSGWPIAGVSSAGGPAPLAKDSVPESEAPAWGDGG